MGIIWIYIMSRVCPTGRPSILRAWWKLWRWSLHVNCSTKFLHTCYAFIGTIDFCHFIPLSLTLTLPGITRSARVRIKLIQSWYYDRYYCTVHFDISLVDLDLVSRSQECEKATTSARIISESFQLIWMVFGILLRLFSVMNIILFLFRPFNIQGRELYLGDFIK